MPLERDEETDRQMVTARYSEGFVFQVRVREPYPSEYRTFGISTHNQTDRQTDMPLERDEETDRQTDRW